MRCTETLWCTCPIFVFNIFMIKHKTTHATNAFLLESRNKCYFDFIHNDTFFPILLHLKHSLELAADCIVEDSILAADWLLWIDANEFATESLSATLMKVLHSLFLPTIIQSQFFCWIVRFFSVCNSFATVLCYKLTGGNLCPPKATWPTYTNDETIAHI